MSRECCGPDEPQAVDDCCAPPGEQHDHDDHNEEPSVWWRDPVLRLPTTSGVLLAVGYALQWPGLHVAATLVLAGGLLAGTWTFVPGTIRRLLRGHTGVGPLMTIAAAGAVALGHVGEAAALAFLFSIAEALEDRAMDRARHGLRALLSLIPQTARLSRLTGDATVPVTEVRAHDILVVSAGERVATDGVVARGRSSVDTSMVTGESIPVEVGPGDAVPAGAVNGAGTLHLEATADGRDNSLTTIVRLVEQAHARKGERARLADRIARPLVPAVLVAAALVAAYGFAIGDPGLWIERALVVLVAASPCALAIAVPVTVISAIGAASRLGVVIKSGEAFERLGTIRMVALDKTGTLTRNRPEVVTVEAADGFTTAGVLGVAAGLEAASTHPLAAAITVAADDPATVTEVEEHAGQGVSGLHEGQPVRAGSPRWIPPGLLRGRTGVGLLMTIAAVGAVALGHVGEAAALAFLFSIAEALEDPAMDRARHGLRALLSLIPETARLSKLTGEVTVPASQVQAYDIVVVGAGERVATDGVMVRGRSSVDTSAVTGESIPVEVGPADAVPSGAVNGAGTLHIEATADVVLFPLALFGVPGLAEVVLVHEEAARATPLALEACPRSHNRPSASFAVLLNCATHR